MTFTEFQDEITSNIKQYLPDSYIDAEISINSVMKNNGLELQGLTIKKSGENVPPTIYLNSMYQDYLDGRELDEILRNIARIRQLHEEDIGLDVSSITDFSAVKDKIQIKLISREKNQDYIKQGNKPHIDVADLTEVFYIDLGEESSSNGFMSTVITEQLMQQYGITDVQELHDIAVRNMTPKARLTSIFQALSAMMPQTVSEEEFNPSDNQLFVLTNDKKHFGAAMLLCPEVMDNVAAEIGTESYYILPSSTEECLIVPEKTGMNVEELASMVKDINSDPNIIGQDVYLSDHIYRYMYDSHQIQIAA